MKITPLTNQDIEIGNQYKEGKSVLVLSKIYNISTSAISRRLKKLGIKARAFSTKGLQTRLGAILSEETKDKISKANLGKKLSPEHRAKVIKTLQNNKGELNPNWKGGVTLSSEGYILVYIPEHPNVYTNGYYPKHRLVMEDKLGRLLETEENVHHIDEDKLNNSPNNLMLVTNKEHGDIHWQDKSKRKERSLMMIENRKRKYWSTKKVY